MAGKLSHTEEVAQARLKLRLLAERTELETRLARRQTGSAFRTGLASFISDPGLLRLSTGALISLLAGLVLARQPRWRTALISLLARQLTR